MTPTKPAAISTAKPVRFARTKWALRDGQDFGVTDAPLFNTAREARDWLTRARLAAKPALTVADLIALLKTYPQDLPVTGYNAHEETSFVTCASVRLAADGGWRLAGDCQHHGSAVKMGRYDPTAAEVRALWESGAGGTQECRTVLKARNMRRALRGRLLAPHEMQELLLALVDGLYPPDPPEEGQS